MKDEKGNFNELFVRDYADIDTISADRGFIAENESVTASLDHDYQTSVVADDGTHYVMHEDSNGDMVLSTSNAPLAEGYSEVYRWSNPAGNARFQVLHITANGTLLTGLDGSLYRSTDGGSTWNTVRALNNAQTASFTENADGSILMVERNGLTVFESTDDGQTWTSIADASTNFPNIEHHIHKVVYHPADDKIILTGGDGPTKAWYRSTDGGSTWTEFITPKGVGQYFPVTPHPTDASVYFAGEDTVGETRGIVRIEDNGGDVTQTRVQDTNPERTTDKATGLFSLSTVHSPSGDNESFYFGSSLNLDTDLLYTSTGLSGYSWRAVAPVSTMTNFHVGQAPYEHVINSDVVDSIACVDQQLRFENATEPLYGHSQATPLDERAAQGDIVLGDGKNRIRSHDSSDESYFWHHTGDNDSHNHVIYTINGNFIFDDRESGNGIFNLRMPYDRWEWGSNADVVYDAGEGPVVTTPDGTTEYRITVDDSGNLTTTQL